MEYEKTFLIFKFIFVISFILYFLLIKFSVHNEEINPDTIMKFKMKLYPYSGFHSESYLKFLNNIELFGKNISNVDVAAKFLYIALEDNAHELLFFSNYDFSIDIKSIAIEAEQLLLTSSLKYKTLFIPKYLNKRII